MPRFIYLIGFLDLVWCGAGAVRTLDIIGLFFRVWVE